MQGEFLYWRYDSKVTLQTLGGVIVGVGFNKINAFDFPLCYSVRESLLDKLLIIHLKYNAAQHSRKLVITNMDDC